MEQAIVLKGLKGKKEEISRKILNHERITPEEGLFLFEEFDLSLLGLLADGCRLEQNGDYVYFNRNFHLEPTNICIHNCLFCSYSRNVNEEGAWEYSLDEVRSLVSDFKGKDVTEIHIVGGVHPARGAEYYAEMLHIVREELPGIHIKGFTAAEIDHMARKSRLSIKEALTLLKKAGLQSMPGGGAEIFDETLRARICPDKTGSARWLEIHQTAHELDLPTNATILYGHLENYAQRIDHLNRLRDLQDKTAGFNAFIPLKYRSMNNPMSETGEVSFPEDLRNYAVTRIFLDNIPHLKAYWPMIGKENATLALTFGVDDLDGTINDTTKIYTMAGVEEQNPGMTVEEIVALVKAGGRIPVERDSLYNPLKIFT
ncbi:MAG TPA: aminofutalosine synthase MqnE [Bacteroidales bacterium]|nr:aminofutalosine synthase MqnE [Bacteroidales bacterium]